jgi:hypothetical protein
MLKYQDGGKINGGTKSNFGDLFEKLIRKKLTAEDISKFNDDNFFNNKLYQATYSPSVLKELRDIYKKQNLTDEDVQRFNQLYDKKFYTYPNPLGLENTKNLNNTNNKENKENSKNKIFKYTFHVNNEKGVIDVEFDPYELDSIKKAFDKAKKEVKDKFGAFPEKFTYSDKFIYSDQNDHHYDYVTRVPYLVKEDNYYVFDPREYGGAKQPPADNYDYSEYDPNPDGYKFVKLKINKDNKERTLNTPKDNDTKKNKKFKFQLSYVDRKEKDKSKRIKTVDVLYDERSESITEGINELKKKLKSELGEDTELYYNTKENKYSKVIPNPNNTGYYIYEDDEHLTTMEAVADEEDKNNKSTDIKSNNNNSFINPDNQISTKNEETTVKNLNTPTTSTATTLPNLVSPISTIKPKVIPSSTSLNFPKLDIPKPEKIENKPFNSPVYNQQQEAVAQSTQAPIQNSSTAHPTIKPTLQENPLSKVLNIFAGGSYDGSSSIFYRPNTLTESSVNAASPLYNTPTPSTTASLNNANQGNYNVPTTNPYYSEPSKNLLIKSLLLKNQDKGLAGNITESFVSPSKPSTTLNLDVNSIIKSPNYVTGVESTKSNQTVNSRLKPITEQGMGTLPMGAVNYSNTPETSTPYRKDISLETAIKIPSVNNSKINQSNYVGVANKNPNKNTSVQSNITPEVVNNPNQETNITKPTTYVSPEDNINFLQEFNYESFPEKVNKTSSINEPTTTQPRYKVNALQKIINAFKLKRYKTPLRDVNGFSPEHYNFLTQYKNNQDFNYNYLNQPEKIENIERIKKIDKFRPYLHRGTEVSDYISRFKITPETNIDPFALTQSGRTPESRYLAILQSNQRDSDKRLYDQFYAKDNITFDSKTKEYEEAYQPISTYKSPYSKDQLRKKLDEGYRNSKLK